MTEIDIDRPPKPYVYFIGYAKKPTWEQPTKEEWKIYNQITFGSYYYPDDKDGPNGIDHCHELVRKGWAFLAMIGKEDASGDRHYLSEEEYTHVINNITPPLPPVAYSKTPPEALANPNLFREAKQAMDSLKKYINSSPANHSLN